MSTERIETIVIGGGQAGLAMSYHLGRLGGEHVVLERGELAERWRSERWDSLHFQSPNWNMNLPGWPRMTADPQADPDAFSPLCEVTGYIERYAANIRAPVRTRCAALSLTRRPESSELQVQTDGTLYVARNVIVATGPYQVPRATPPLGGGVFELHSTQYRNLMQLPAGAVLVVGSGNSGVQIAEELCCAGRRVFLSVSSHERIRRRYRGKDCIWWLIATGSADATLGEWKGARLSRLMTGVNGGYDIDLRRLAAEGIVLIGRVQAAENGRIAVADDLASSMAHGDESLAAFTRRCDDAARVQQLDLPPPDPSPDPKPEPPELQKPIRTVDLVREGIRSVIWAVGAQTEFSWIDLPVFGQPPGSKRTPVHERGVTPEAGLYFLGLPWLHKWKSAFLFGADEDAAYLAAHIVSRRRN
ncbi:NAD(P)-binding domain-containing protein [Variovorax ginsengisoli]|uniref:NAD(P)-binding domain-containing protein n=1 Tax=Variovorax ginsengisoli TaxID=363844 RepID=A0ABT8SFN6_9BURK|nr:NAD(P)-binding domain-containing protein [Variovorax ginsengisoli]MDN8618534.1 NAD(P)-binding domain-containing protein [Variovorax ginsengisoli]MDO1537704.1 NAD(P)-binding domain-containing protein [Variovorax ginsengisoli]